MGRIEADIALESWLLRFRPCLGQGQLTVRATIQALSFIMLTIRSS